MNNLMKTGHILIADSYETTKTILKLSIEHLCPRCRITTVGDGRDALDILEKDNVQLMLVDCDAPGLGGLELIKTIHKAWPDVRLVAMSGLENDGRTCPPCNDLEIDGFLNRPFGLDRLEYLLMTTL